MRPAKYLAGLVLFASSMFLVVGIRYNFHSHLLAKRRTMIDYRIEKDSLGEVQVPAGAYYGAQTQRAINNFHISGLRPWRAFVWSMATIKRAAAEVNRDLGLLDTERAEAIAQAAQEV